MVFTRTLTLNHSKDDFLRQNLGCSEIQFNNSDNAILNFIRDLDGLIVDKNRPFEGVIESVPLFINAASYPLQLASSFVERILDAGTNVIIEFRTSEREDMGGATDWKSVSLDGANSNFVKIDFSGYTGPTSTDSVNLVTAAISENGVVTGFTMNGKNTDSSKDFVHFISEEIASSVLTTQAKYLAFEVESDRAGIFLELNVTHGLSYSVDYTLDDVPSPFKHEIHICDADSPQTIYWDISDWPEGERNFDYIRAFSFKVVEASDDFNLTIDNVRLVGINDSTVVAPSTPGEFPAEPQRFIQYRVIFSTISAGVTPEVKSVKFDFTHREAILPSNLMRHQKYMNSNNILTYPDRNALDIVYA